ncbi:hypothetical protein Zmor_017364 [Zophobas morio]|uniref:Uncharacterized protein n=1 Tax=Zophobas morio TaxID=2755281 RepID=A0AA38IC75_9CUCU|nr:hypothetical protein Zmor_017364 [Zophobas morio]
MGTTSSTIKFVNDTSTDIVNISGSDSNGFDSMKITRRSSSLDCLIIHTNSSPVIFTLTFKDKSEDIFRIDLKYAVGCCAQFNHIKKSHEMSYRLDDKKIIITIKNTAEQNKNEEAEESLRSARQAMRRRLYDQALDHLSHAKNLASKADIVSEIRSEESEVYSSYGDSMFEEGLSMERTERFQAAEGKFSSAKSFFQRSLKLVYSGETREKIRLSELKISGNRSTNTAKELENDASVMVENEEYETALDKYEAALRKYKEAKRKFEEGRRSRDVYFSDSVKATEDRIGQVDGFLERTRDEKQNKEAKELLREAKRAKSQHLYDFAVDCLDRAKTLAVRSDTLNDIENEESRVCSLHGETMFEEGLDYEQREHSEMAESKFARAESLFRRLLRLVNSSETRQKLRLVELKINGCKGLNQGVKLENQAMLMNNDKGYELALNKYHAALTIYQEVRDKYLEGAKNRISYFSNSLNAVNKKIEQVEAAIESTTKQQHNEEAKALIKEAEKATKQNLYDFALEHLKSAKILTNQPDTLTKIKNEESNVCSLYGKSVFEDGLELEKKGHSERAQSKFKKAKTWFQRAKESVSSNELQQNLQLVGLKLSGDRSFAEAVTLKDEGVEMIKKEDYDSALDKYVSALAKCKEAKEKYMEGAGCRKEYFSNSLKLINEQIEQIKVTIRNTEAQMRDANAKELIQKAKTARSQNFYDVALEHLSLAKVSANQTHTITSIRKEESKVCYLYGTMLFEEGMDSEKEGNVEQAKIRFHKAKSVLQRGMKLVDCEETKKKLRLVELKISGDKKFNKAVELDNEASLCQDDEQHKEALDQYDAALGKYKEAKEDYVEGAKHEEEYFARSVKIADEQIERVEDTVNEINSMQMLQGQISGLRIDNRTSETVEDDKEEVESKLQNTFIQR